MLRKESALLLLLLLPLFILASCGPAEPVATSVPSGAPTAAVAAVASPRPVGTLRPTLTPAPSSTPTPRPTLTPRPSSTTTPLPTQAPTALPTLPPAQQQAFVLEMVRTNGGCDLPCWWGITPGETSWDEAQALFLEGGLDISRGQLDLVGPSPEGGPVGMLTINFRQAAGVVQRVQAYSASGYAALWGDFDAAWQRFAPHRILSRYGIPSQVYLVAEVGAACLGPGIFPTYTLWVVYEDLGMALGYPGILLRDNLGWIAGLAFGQVPSIDIVLQSPAVAAPLVDLSAVDGEFVIGAPLADLTGMDPEAFYDAFAQPEPQAYLFISPTFPWYEEDRVSLPDTPALSPAAEDALLVELLETGGGCDLPCWWGITPGATSWADAQRHFLSYGKSIVRWEAEVGTAHQVALFGQHDPYPFGYVVRHLVYERDGEVVLLGVLGHSLGYAPWWSVRPTQWSPSERFVQDWARYRLDQVLARLGRPSQVLLHYWPYAGESYSIALLYDDLGVLVEYIGVVEGEGGSGGELEQAYLCPGGGRVSDINMWVLAPGREWTLRDVFSREGGGYYIRPHYMVVPTLEEAAGVSVEQFYQAYLDAQAGVCLEVSAAFGDEYP